MELAKLAGCVLLCIGCCSAQELGLTDYLQRLKSAPGVSIDQKVEWLSNMGVTLSRTGLQELEAAAKKTAPSYTTPYTSPYAATGPTYMPPLQTSPPQTYTPPIEMPASGTANKVGNYNYYNFDNGVTGTSNRVGNYDYYSFSNGLNGTSNRIGNYTYQNWNDGVSGTGSHVGNYNYFNWSDGTSATQTKIGNQTYTNFSNGKMCTTQRIGAYSYTNCN